MQSGPSLQAGRQPTRRSLQDQSVFLLADDDAQAVHQEIRKLGEDRNRLVVKEDADLSEVIKDNHLAQPTLSPSGRWRQETRTCRGCCTDNCPDNLNRTSAEHSKIMIATGGDDIADEDVYNSTAYVISDAIETTKTPWCSLVPPKSY